MIAIFTTARGATGTYMASDTAGIQDIPGEFSDWFKLFRVNNFTLMVYRLSLMLYNFRVMGKPTKLMWLYA